MFMGMDVPPSTTLSDSDDDGDDEPDGRRRLKARGQSRTAPIAVVGAGPAGLTCATYLARLGYRCVTVYEAGEYAGGLRYVTSPPRLHPPVGKTIRVLVRLDLPVAIRFGQAKHAFRLRTITVNVVCRIPFYRASGSKSHAARSW